MKFSLFAGHAIVPTLSRIVLCAAFIATGFHKVFGEASFTETEATRLQQLGVSVRKDIATTAGLLTPGDLAAVTLTLVAAQSQPEQPTGGAVREPTAPPTPPVADPVQPADDPEVDVPDVESDEEGDVERAVEDAADEIGDAARAAGSSARDAVDDLITKEETTADKPYHARAVHGLTLMLDARQFPQPLIMAWLAALTEFVGGILLLIGLFSRVWGLGLAVAMAVAFYLTSVEAYFASGIIEGPFEAGAGADEHALFNRVFAQLGLFTLAFGIFLAGPGPLSLDRLLFRRGEMEDDLN